MTIKWLIVRFWHHTWKIWRSEAAGGGDCILLSAWVGALGRGLGSEASFLCSKTSVRMKHYGWFGVRKLVCVWALGSEASWPRPLEVFDSKYNLYEWGTFLVFEYVNHFENEASDPRPPFSALDQQSPGSGSRDCECLNRHNFLIFCPNGASEVSIGIYISRRWR
jgi:hypothetical protein